MAVNSIAIRNDGRQKVAMRDEICLLDPNAAPFTVLTSKIQKEVTIAPKFEWLNRNAASTKDTTTASIDNSTNTKSVAVSNGGYFRPGMIILAETTGEHMKVESVSSNTLTVARGYGETTATALTSGATLNIIGNANAEMSGAPNDATGAPTKDYNYTQIIRTPFAISGTAKACGTYGGKLLSQEQVANGIDHRVSVEKALIFGERYEDLSNNIRTTRGVLKFISLNGVVKSSAGNLSELDFNKWLADVFAHGSSRKVLFASPLLVTVIDSWGNNKVQTKSEGSASLGIAVTEYISSHGQLTIVKEPLFTGSIYGGYGMVLDMKKLKYRYMAERDTALNTNIQNNDVDGRRDEYFTECGLEVQNPECHGLITGVTGAA